MNSFYRVVGAGALTAACLAGLSASALEKNEYGYTFDVFRKGSQIGTHEIVIDVDGERLIVDTKIRFKVKLLFVTVYRYEHDSHEEWQDGRLVAFSSDTLRKGLDTKISGEAVDDGFRIIVEKEGEDTRELVAPADILVTSYWHPATLQQKQLLHSEKGTLLDVGFTPLGTEKIETPAGGVMTTKKYEIVSEKLAFNLWYDQRDCLAGIGFYPPNDDTYIDYKLTSNLGEATGTALADHPIIGKCVGPVDEGRVGEPMAADGAKP